jgi:hypothetical protein
MKRLLIGLLLAGVYLLAQVRGVRAEASQEDVPYCGPIPDAIKFEGGMLGGDVGIQVSGYKAWPDKPIVIGQDESHRGVDISVTISALKGEAKYWRTRREVIGESFPMNIRASDCSEHLPDFRVVSLPLIRGICSNA